MSASSPCRAHELGMRRAWRGKIWVWWFALNGKNQQFQRPELENVNGSKMWKLAPSQKKIESTFRENLFSRSVLLFNVVQTFIRFNCTERFLGCSFQMFAQ